MRYWPPWANPLCLHKRFLSSNASDLQQTPSRYVRWLSSFASLLSLSVFVFYCHLSSFVFASSFLTDVTLSVRLVTWRLKMLRMETSALWDCLLAWRMPWLLFQVGWSGWMCRVEPRMIGMSAVLVARPGHGLHLDYGVCGL
jgi:hypothetical protein